MCVCVVCCVCIPGPLKKTIGDFWNMVWANNVLVIVMTTKFVEAAKVKCAEYWSDVEQQQYRGIAIQVCKVDKFAEYEQRTMRIRFEVSCTTVMRRRVT